jgi:hypothetical protein
MRSWLKGGLLGLVGIFAVCGLTYYNDGILKGTFFVGNNMPLSVYGGLVIFLLTVNLLLGKVAPRLSLTGAEVAIGVTLTLAVCCIPGSGLMRTFPTSIIMPHHHKKTVAGWKENRIVQLAPEQMLVDVTTGEDGNENEVLLEYMQGWGGADKPVPWGAWRPALGFWIPLALMIWVSLLGLAMVVHRQWSDHEHLPYPIVTFTGALLPGEDGRLAAIFRERLFWIGAGFVMLLYMNNYLVTVLKLDWVWIPTEFSVEPLVNWLGLHGHGGSMGNIRLYFTAVAFAFLLSTHVSFSVGIAPTLYAILVTVCAGVGVTLGGGGYFAANPEKTLVFGAYLMMAAVVVYTGRTYYFNVCRRALGLESSDEVDGVAVAGCRLFALMFLCSVAWIARLGLDWQLSVLYVGGVVLTFVIMSRIIAETGLFFMQVYWLPCTILVGLLGAQALGPTTMLTLYLLSMVLAVDPREAFMPFIVNALKLSDDHKVKLLPTSGGITMALLLGMAIAVTVTITLQYRHGAPLQDGWATKWVPIGPFNEALSYKQRLDAQGALGSAESVRGFARLAKFSPQSAGLVWGLLGGAALVLICTIGRLRYTWWPLHPVAFLIWTTYPGKYFAWSFLVGWMLKVVVMKYGGAGTFQKLKPLVFGLIAGEMVGLLIPIVVNMIAGSQGVDLPAFKVLPG